MGCTLELSMRSSSTLRRISWALGVVMVVIVGWMSKRLAS